MICDYLGCTQINPISILLSFNDERFQGKDIGKLMINFENLVILKCTDQLHPFYKSAGFEALPQSSKCEKIKI